MQPGDTVLLTETKNKLSTKATGPYCIVRTHTNGNVTIQESCLTQQCVNIHRIRPYVTCDPVPQPANVAQQRTTYNRTNHANRTNRANRVNCAQCTPNTLRSPTL